MADPNHWVHKICQFLTYCRKTWAGGTGTETGTSQHVGEGLEVDLPGTRFLGLLHGNREMPKNCRVFLGFVNILTVAIVVGLAMEDTSPDDPQLQKIEDDHAQGDRSDIQEHDRKSGHGIQELTVENSTLPSTKEEVETSNAGEAHERVTGTSTTSAQHRVVCNYCTSLAKKAVGLLTECGYCGSEEHTVRPTECRICGGIEHTDKSIHGYRVDLPPNLESVPITGNDIGAAQGDFGGHPRDVQPEDQRYPVPTQRTLYWRNRVLDILAPSLPPLPILFNDSRNMNDTVHNVDDNVVEADRGDDGVEQISSNLVEEDEDDNEVEQTRGQRVGNGGADETAHERSHRLQDEAALDVANHLETILENEENDVALQRTRARTYSLREQQNPPQTRVQIHLSASVPCPQTGVPHNYSGYLGCFPVPAARQATPPGANRNDSHSNSPMPHSRTFVVTYNPTSAPTEMAQPEFSNAQMPEYYANNRAPLSTGTLSRGGNTINGQPHFSSSDDDEIRSQSSSSHSSRSYRSRSTPVPLGRPRLQISSIALRDRFRPRGRVLSRRPRCGLRMMKALRDDPSCTPEEGKTRRQPGREDKLFSPRRGDVICRHTVVPGRGVVEIYFPGLEEYLQDGDSLVRLKMDNVSYPTMLILSAKAYLFLQGRWMYLGRHQHGVRKPKKEWLLG